MLKRKNLQKQKAQKIILEKNLQIKLLQRKKSLLKKEIILEEMIEILKPLGIDQNLVPIIQIMKTLREKFLAEIIIMLQN